MVKGNRKENGNYNLGLARLSMNLEICRQLEVGQPCLPHLKPYLYLLGHKQAG